MTRVRMHAILDGDDPSWGRTFAVAIQTIIVLSCVAIAIETLPDNPLWLDRGLLGFELVVVSIFTVEYVARVWSAPNRLRYVFSVFGVVDLLSILPTLLLVGYDLHALRALRLVRVLRLFKLVRYVKAFERLARAFRSVLAELVVFAGLASIVLFLCASAIYWFENEAQPEVFASIPHSMWWAVVTLTTVGYGDAYPVTAGGRIFTGVMLLIALGIIAVPTGLVASALSSERVREAEGDRERDGGRP